MNDIKILSIPVLFSWDLVHMVNLASAIPGLGITHSYLCHALLQNIDIFHFTLQPGICLWFFTCKDRHEIPDFSSLSFVYLLIMLSNVPS